MTDILAKFFNDNYPTNHSITNLKIEKKALLNKYKINNTSSSEFNTFFPAEVATNSTNCPTLTNDINNLNFSRNKSNKLLKNKSIMFNRDEISKNANEIVNTLLENKNEDEYEYAEIKKTKDDLKEQPIDPKFYIKENLRADPEQKKNFKSIKLQIKCLGNMRNRQNLIKGVNEYELNSVKYKNLNNYIGEYQNNNTNKNNKIAKNKIKILFSEGTNQPLPPLKKNNRIQRNKNIHLELEDFYTRYLPSLEIAKTIDERLKMSYESAHKTLLHFQERREELQKKKNDLIAISS